jgi:hypothetical protein
MADRFKIKLARVETVSADADEPTVCLTFQIENASGSFRLPIVLPAKDFDDTEIVKASRSALHETFVELAAQTNKWKLTTHDLKLLSSMNLRHKK